MEAGEGGVSKATLQSASLRRFIEHKPPLKGIVALAPNHPSVIEGRTKYRKRIVWSGVTERLLKSGHNNRKIGARVQKGAWWDMPIYTLTLEERATCPRSCRHWLDCYGNKMNWSERLMHGPALEQRLGRELRELQKKYPRGFVVRLHVLGDFYSVAYVKRWLSWLRRFPALRVFGYTARGADDPIGALIADARDRMWDRFAVRTSNHEVAECGTETIYYEPNKPVITEGIVCPAQTGRAECCATCALCWSTRHNVAFMAH